MDIRALQLELELDVDRWMEKANQKLGSRLEPPKVKIRFLGQFGGRANSYFNCIEFNPVFVKQNWEQFRARTVPHEVAHIVADKYYGKSCGHGKEWRHVMSNVLGIQGVTRCHSYDVTEALRLNGGVFIYKCGCKEWKFSHRRHNSSERNGGNWYTCPSCRQPCRFDRRG